MADVQGNYNERHSAASLGMIADTRFKSVRSFNVEGSENIGFGIAMTFGDNDNGAKLGGTKFAGIVVATQTSVVENGYAPGTTIGLMDIGSIWVAPTVAVAPGDPVTFDPATGALSNTGGTAIADAEYETTATPGQLARVRIK